jgi:hypothetical protein
MFLAFFYFIAFSSHKTKIFDYFFVKNILNGSLARLGAPPMALKLHPGSVAHKRLTMKTWPVQTNPRRGADTGRGHDTQAAALQHGHR